MNVVQQQFMTTQLIMFWAEWNALFEATAFSGNWEVEFGSGTEKLLVVDFGDP